jgi:hypothetical protein
VPTPGYWRAAYGGRLTPIKLYADQAREFVWSIWCTNSFQLLGGLTVSRQRGFQAFSLSSIA